MRVRRVRSINCNKDRSYIVNKSFISLSRSIFEFEIKMLELVPISFTFASLAKVILILGINTLLSYTWYSSYAFQKQWLQAMQWKEGDESNSIAMLMSNIGALLNSFLLHILLIAFDIRKQQWISAILASAILTGFYAVSVR